MSFSRRANPVWLFDDLVGNILDDNYYMSFLENTIPYLPQPAYQDEQGINPWANPLQFHPDGTLPDNLYFQDGLVYRLEIRRGPTQSDPLIRLIENFSEEGGSNPSVINLPIDNQITNPQFAFIDFNETLVLTNTGNNSYDIAPGWILDLESSGSAVLTVARTPIAGDDNIPTESPTNPSYVVSFEITSGTFTSVKLRQRFDHAPAIWASEGISICFTGKMLLNSAEIIVEYVPSDGTSHIIIDDSLSSVYQFISGGIQLPESDSTDTGANGYVDIVFTLPISGTCFITNVQAIGSVQHASYPYAQTTVERQKDQTFHVYSDSILQQAKDTLLTGWTFALNPWQFTTTSNTNVANNTYTADQTIIVQQKYVESAAGNNISVARGSAAQNYAFVVTAVTATNEFAMIQYIDPSTIRPYWGQNLSALVKAAISTAHTTACKFKMRLIYRVDAPHTISQTEPIATWVSGDEPILAAGWTAIAPLNDPEYTFGDGSVPFAFDQFELPASSADAMTLGIMLYTTSAMDEASTADALLFNRISLVPNDYAIDASPETWDESLRKCQFYYEKSYPAGVLPAAVTNTGAKVVRMNNPYNGSESHLYFGSFELNYRQTKRVAPTFTIYSNTSGISDTLNGSIERNGGTPAPAAGTNPQNFSFSGNYSIVNISPDQCLFFCGDTSTIKMRIVVGDPGDGSLLSFHYTADSRQGI